jgi:hypothetical protein
VRVHQGSVGSRVRRQRCRRLQGRCEVRTVGLGCRSMWHLSELALSDLSSDVAMTLRRNRPLRRLTRLTWRRKAVDRVPDAEANYVFARDRSCRAPLLDRDAGPCYGRLTLEHVKDAPMVGKRAPSDRHHMLVLCYFHNTGWALTSDAKARERAYLRRVEGEAA